MAGSLAERVACLERYVKQLWQSAAWSQNQVAALLQRKRARVISTEPISYRANPGAWYTGLCTRHRQCSSVAAPLSIGIATGNATRHRQAGSTAVQLSPPHLVGNCSRHRQILSFETLLNVTTYFGFCTRHRKAVSTVAYNPWNTYTGNATRHRQVSSNLILPYRAIYGQRATVWFDEALVASGSVWTRGNPTGVAYNVASFFSSPLVGNEVVIGFTLAAGTYNFGILYAENTDAGQFACALDYGSTFLTIDGYASSLAYNYNLANPVTVTGSGYHVLSITVTGKNASSSNYYIRLVKAWFYPSTETPNTQ